MLGEDRLKGNMERKVEIVFSAVLLWLMNISKSIKNAIVISYEKHFCHYLQRTAKNTLHLAFARSAGRAWKDVDMGIG